MGQIKKTKAERVQELLDYIEPIAKESRDIVYPGGKLADDWTDEQDERLAWCLAEETRVSKEIRKICEEEPPGAATPGVKIQLPEDREFNQQQVEKLQRGLYDAETRFNGEEPGLEYGELGANDGTTASSQLDALSPCLAWVHHPSFEFMLNVAELADQICAGRKSFFSKEKFNVIVAKASTWNVKVLHRFSPHFLGRHPQHK